MSDLDQVLRDLNSDVARVEHLLNLVKGFREFGGSSPPELLTGGPTAWPEGMSLFQSSKQRRTDLPVLSGSLTLYLAGRFEYFIRQVVETIADEISLKVSRYADLPESLRNELKSRTLEVCLNPRRYGFDDQQANACLQNLVDNLRTTLTPIRISAAVLSITEANMKDRVLADVMKRVGMTNYWKDVGKQAPMKLLLEKREDGEATIEAQTHLNKLMDDRNQIAHPTAATVFPDPDQVLKAAQFIRVISQVTVDLSRVYLSGFTGCTHLRSQVAS